MSAGRSHPPGAEDEPRFSDRGPRDDIGAKLTEDNVWGPGHEASSVSGPAGGSPTTADGDGRRDASQTSVSTAEPRRREPAKKAGGAGGMAFLRELPVLLLVAFLLALLIKTFVVQAFYIPSESMENTLLVGDRVLVNKVVYHLHEPRRGDVIVFADPHPGVQPHRNPVSAFWHWLTEGLGVSTDPEKDFIKRVIGLPGETVEGKNGTVYVDGKPLTEPYVKSEDLRAFGPFHVPADNLFVMGDNRTNSADSRFGLGFIPLHKVIGRAFVTIWPPTRIGWLHGL